MVSCGKTVIHVIAGASWIPCALESGHEGPCRGEGTCTKHGKYIGAPHSMPQCPHWPTCVSELVAAGERSKEKP